MVRLAIAASIDAYLVSSVLASATVEAFNVQDGRVLIEALTTKATPQALVAHRETVHRLSEVYEQLNASFGSFALERVGCVLVTAQCRA